MIFCLKVSPKAIYLLYTQKKKKNCTGKCVFKVVCSVYKRNTLVVKYRIMMSLFALNLIMTKEYSIQFNAKLALIFRKLDFTQNGISIYY